MSADELRSSKEVIMVVARKGPNDPPVSRTNRMIDGCRTAMKSSTAYGAVLDHLLSTLHVAGSQTWISNFGRKRPNFLAHAVCQFRLSLFDQRFRDAMDG